MECPYCNKSFKSWISVRAHVSGCSKNNRDYIISVIYGPILFSNLHNLSIREINGKFPLLEDSLKRYIVKKLAKADLHIHDRQFQIENAKESVLAFFKQNGRVPTGRDTYTDKTLPSASWCKSIYGTWNNFIESCGLISNDSGFGVRTLALDGCWYRSSLEAAFVDKYLFEKYNYEYEKPYPTGNRISDFYIEELDLYIEVAGGFRPEVLEEKIAYCINNKLHLKVLHPKQILSGKISLSERK